MNWCYKAKKKRKPKLTRLEKMTKGLMLPVEDVKSKFTVREVEDKGRALFLRSRIIRKDSFVVEYEGDVITYEEAEFREKIYEVNEEGCYILFFRFQGRRLAIDATRRFDSYARYLNHSREPNLRFHPPLLLDLTGKGVPRIAGYALRDIHEGEEIVFDYGVSDGEIKWLRNRKHHHASELTDSSSDEDSSSTNSDQTSNKDLVMSVTRTPMNSNKDLLSFNFNTPKNNLCLKPSKYLTQGNVPTVSKPKPPSLSIPRNGYGIRYIAYPSRPGMKKCFIGSVEGLGQPLQIMRSVEERTSNSGKQPEQYSQSQSVISLSETDDSSVMSPVIPYVPLDKPSCSLDSHLPFNSTPSSASKVLEWQQKIKPSPTEQQDTLSDIKIVHVGSVMQESETAASSSISSPSKSFSSCYNPTMQKTPKNSLSALPCISNVMYGSCIPMSFVPSMHSGNSNHDDDRMSAHHIPSSSTEIITSNSVSKKHSPRKFNSDNHRTNAPYSERSGITSVKVKYSVPIKSQSSPEQLPVKQHSNVGHKTSNVSDMIFLSDSEEDIIFHDDDDTIVNRNPNEQIVAGKEKDKKLSIRDQKLCGNSELVSDRINFNSLSCSKMYIPQDHEKTQSKDKIGDILISNVESLKHDFRDPFQCSKESHQHPEGLASGKNYVKHKDADLVEIFDEEQSYIEIISDEEMFSSRLSNSFNNKLLSPKCETTPVNPPQSSCPKSSIMLNAKDTTHHRSKPHNVAIVKPYSMDNDQDIVLEQNTAVQNENVEMELPGEMSAVEGDNIELFEENSEEDDGIILAEDKSVESHIECKLTQEEKEKMKVIFQPLSQSSDSLVSSCVEKAISENFNFFSVLIERGVSVNQIRRTVWELFKESERGITKQS